ncbi:16S rRNA (adenine(1518)-N(6)/adenine(1519)-N(6))-dimethyltransferase RsmA [Salinibius halmophilus]|uniref:16S rRNA (adenine(1518)-N(6)/adenine(1519)-N(6))- dimethyltransferase RsmA n=1 Tax=Salinibius halmophilus TaxID=1853216 RepID=UPI000E664C0F|nr:16S rRNA (adenine(1518)-N(6)/adenine(1519)-N(6))-dimethyltransferase RsmA [Salinibius halmophilus]
MHKARKRFGQNFLHDQRVIDRIISAINPKPGQRIVEIGPGQGAMTEGLLAGTQGHLDVVELDRDLVPILRAKFFQAAALTIHEADAMKFDFSALAQAKIRVVGNLPYNISTPLIFHLLSHKDSISDMHFMLQKEVVERLCAEPGSSAYGRLGVMVQYYCDSTHLFNVGPGAFNPPPKVDSAIVRLMPRPATLQAKDEQVFANLVRQAFSQRRKTLKNNLKGLLTAEQIESLDISASIRPEKVSVEQFVALSNLL